MSRQKSQPELSAAARELFSKAVVCWLASADENGRPSVSPKEIFVVESPKEILIAHIASPRSVRNIAANGEVCVAALDVFEQRGFQAYGHADVVHRHESDFAAIAAPLIAMAGPAFPVQAVIRVSVRESRSIEAPSLWMYPDVDPAERRAAVLRAYGVQEAEDRTATAQPDPASVA